jgi:hypothetical protein
MLLGNLLDRWWEFMKTIPEPPCRSVHLKVLQFTLAFLIESLFNEEIQST